MLRHNVSRISYDRAALLLRFEKSGKGLATRDSAKDYDAPELIIARTATFILDNQLWFGVIEETLEEMGLKND